VGATHSHVGRWIYSVSLVKEVRQQAPARILGRSAMTPLPRSAGHQSKVTIEGGRRTGVGTQDGHSMKLSVITVFGALLAPVMAQVTPASNLPVSGLIATTRIVDSGLLQLTLQNVSNRVVTAYKMRWSNGAFTEQATDLIGSLMPSVDAHRQFRAGKSLSLDDPFGPNTRPVDVAVVGVVYDDNSWEGESRFAGGIFTGRRQHALAIENLVLPILRSGTEQDVSRTAEQMRTAFLTAQQSRDLDGLNAAQFLKAVPNAWTDSEICRQMMQRRAWTRW
jgi:hypothetical protein